MCLSSSFSRAGYLSSLVKGLLRLLVKVKIPGPEAPFDSMNSPSSSLRHTRHTLSLLWKSRASDFLVSFVPTALLFLFFVPVPCEYSDRGGMVGTVGHIHGLHLGHQTQEKPSDPLLALWKSAPAQTVVY